MKNPKVIAATVLGILFVILLFQNTDDITLHLYFWRLLVPQIILILLALLIGFAGGFITAKLVGRKKIVEGPKAQQPNA